MSNALVPFDPPNRPTRLNRQTRKEVSLAYARGSVLAARESAKVEALEEITGTALMAAASISTLEGLLVARVPHAEARLQHIADSGVAGMADVVLRAARSLK